jgi:NAD(P)-dependent dehydrogenase (short-subunit alcohol dehydrogenase family)
MTSAAPSSSKPPRPRSPHFPPHNAPRVWFITRGVSPIAIALARQVLEHGDYVVAGVMPIEFEKREGQSEDFRNFLEEVKRTERWRERLRVVGLDARVVGQLLRRSRRLSALMCFCAQLVKVCSAPPPCFEFQLRSVSAVIGAVEELAQSSRTISLVDEIFEINFFANVNIIKAILPVMRERKNGHIIVITGISKRWLSSRRQEPC